ncbi:hypothetical protein PWG71_03590 [Nocardiopsis sp. N85]|uniref:hypothetical protein n=1 Tax=Nocardiopsis sp. N85 TaxID=3029400 RepID=UPI00237F0056|nr:hypothetical protein [Nocardiopsis sp. N85]MDE3720457.1 hypothetical protein [Nocardiopsis sp. N85]
MHRIFPPLEGYEGLSLGELERRVRSLDAERVRELIGYERSHEDRADVMELLEDRLAEYEGGRERPLEPRMPVDDAAPRSPGRDALRVPRAPNTTGHGDGARRSGALP